LCAAVERVLLPRKKALPKVKSQQPAELRRPRPALLQPKRQRRRPPQVRPRQPETHRPPPLPRPRERPKSLALRRPRLKVKRPAA
jgi:hypothetical protein